MDYQKLAQEVVNLVKNLYYANKSMHDAYDSVVCALKKYNTDINKVSLNIAGDIDYKKLIWQIIIDLRFAKGTDYDFDNELYRSDCTMLSEISYLIRNKTDEFCMDGSTLIDISMVTRQEYLDLIEQYELK